jgi:O-acetyl-ADP-ribose deacetylase (regulator of RNase III)
MSTEEFKNKVKMTSGNILTCSETYIAHQCNLVTKVAAGLSLSIFTKFPYADIYTERKYIKPTTKTGEIRLMGNGKENRYIINMIGQNYPGKPKEYETRKDRLQWFNSCLLKMEILDIENKSIAFPYNIGCGLAGGVWPDYLGAIQNFAERNPKTTVIIYNNN